MFKHHFLLIYRNFKRNKGSFFINLTGLSTGLVCAILIYLWVHDELNVDKFHENDRRIYQVMQNIEDPGGVQTGTGTPGILAKALAEEIPEIEYASSVVPAEWFSNNGILTYEKTRIKTKARYIDEHYFNIFSCDFIHGDKNQVLSDKYGIAISEDMAEKLFGTDKNVIGKTVEWNQGQSSGLFHVTGIFKRPPPNATAQYDLLVNYELFLEAHPWLREWGNSDPSTFVLLKAGTDVAHLNEKIHGFIQSKANGSNQTLFLQQYSDRYLHGRYEKGQPVGGRIEYVRLFSIIAIFVLVIACINFMNLSTAQASKRVKEVGIKKAIGVDRRTLIMQFFRESMLLSFSATFVAILLVLLLLPAFNEITGKQLKIEIHPGLILPLLGITVFTGTLSGSYPSLFLSGFRPAEVLKGKLPNSVSELWARKGLVVFQFCISVLLIVSVVVIYKQIEYVQSKNLGYNRNNVLYFEMEIPNNPDENFLAEGGIFEKNVETFLNEVKNIPGVINAANFYHDLTGNHGGLSGVDWEDGSQDESNQFNNLIVGYDFIETLGIDMESGRNFSRRFADDRSAIIVNEAAIKLMGLDDPVNKKIRLWGQERKIIGVTKNFHFESLFEEVKPCLIQLEPRAYKIMVSLESNSQKEIIARLQQFYEQHNPGLTFDYKFVDDDYQALYKAEQKVSSISKYFAATAILISCLGLFGLATFTAQKRLKEIGIRKILGSNELGIVKILSGEFNRMIIVSIAIALPLSYFISERWLQNFAYHIDLKWWYFAVAGIATLLIAWFTVCVQTVKAAMVNPTKILRSE